jgi:putative effector of murein hydrolase
VKIHEIWVYLSGSPLLALFITLAAYHAGSVIYERANRHPAANPVFIAVVLAAGAITLVDMPNPKYFEGAQFVHFLLGTATVSLAVPIYKGFAVIRGRIVPLLAALLAGAATSIASAVAVAKLLGADPSIVGALWLKSVTAPIAMGVAERIGVSPTLTAVFGFILDLAGSKAWWQRGFALGVASHGIGASRAFSVHPEAGAFASLAMGLHGILGALLIPLAARYLPG